MNAYRAPGWLRAFRITHPFPTLVNVLTTGGLGLVSTHGTGSRVDLLRLMLAMSAIQACIGTVNDIADRGLDATSKPAKPLIQGVISVGTARVAAVAGLLAAVLLSAGFGSVAWLLAMTGLGCGLAYDLVLKRTAASAFPLMIGLPLLPLWIWVALARFQLRLLLLVPLGCLLGLALQLANSLPDYETDTAAGAHGLAHCLGKARALAYCWGCYALFLIIIGVSAFLFRFRVAAWLPGFGIGLLSLGWSVAAYWRRPTRASLQTGWGLLATGGAALALGWLGGLPAA